MKISNSYSPNINIYYSSTKPTFKGKKCLCANIIKEREKQAIDFVKSISESNEKISSKIYEFSPYHEECIRLKSGKPVAGFLNLYKYDKFYTCYFNEKTNALESCYKFDKLSGNREIYQDGKKICYSKDEFSAIEIYKNNSKNFHSKLRDNKSPLLKLSVKDLNNNINIIENIFNAPEKTLKTKEDMVLYRAMQPLDEKEFETLSTVGAIYENKSFISTSKNFLIADYFNNNDFILKINVPKGTKYIDLDRIFNIDRIHWHEEELLLDKKTKFKVKSTCYGKNYSEVDLIS